MSVSNTSYNFKDNLTIDNNKYLKWLDATGLTRSNVIALDTLNNLNINSANGDLYLNSNNSGSNTYINVSNESNVLVASNLGVGFSTASHVTSNITLVKDGYIGLNTTQGTNDGYLGLSGSHALSVTSGSKLLLYGIDNTVGNSGKIQLYAGNSTSGNIDLYTGDSGLRFSINNNGSAQFTPDGSTVICSIAESHSTFTNTVRLTNTMPSSSATTGALQVAGGIGVSGNCYVDGTLSVNSVTGNINFDSSQMSSSYTSGAIFISGGLGISNTSFASSVTAGGGISVAGGAAIAKNVFIGGVVTMLDSTAPTSSQTGSLVLYGGLGINGNILSRNSAAPQIRLAPSSDGGETSIAFFSTNNFLLTGTGGSTTWWAGQNVGSIGQGNFGIHSINTGTIITATYNGNVGINTTDPSSTLQVNGNGLFTSTLDATSSTSGGAFTVLGGASFAKNVYVGGPILKIPSGDTTERPSVPAKGYVRYNTETDRFEGYGGGNVWGSLGGVSDVDQNTKIEAEIAPGTNDNNLRFITDGAERMRIDESGNIAIGSTTNVASDGDEYLMRLSVSNTDGNYSLLQLENSTFSDTWLKVKNSGTSIQIGVVEDFAYIAPNNASLLIGSSSQVIIHTSGNVSIGTFDEDYKLQVVGVVGCTEMSTGNLYFTHASGSNLNMSNVTAGTLTADSLLSSSATISSLSGTANQLNVVSDSLFSSTTQSLGVGTGGSLTVLGGASFSKDVYVGGTVTSSSDIRLKENIRSIKLDDTRIVDTIDNIRTVKYNYINDPDLLEQIGFIAQDFELNFPEIVRKPNESGYYTLDYPKVSVLLLECVRELRDEITELKSRIRDLV
jgi:hypothetical protein